MLNIQSSLMCLVKIILGYQVAIFVKAAVELSSWPFWNLGCCFNWDGHRM